MAATPNLAPDDLVDGLRHALGERAVITDDATEIIDWRRKFTGRAVAVVRPATTGEVATVVRGCADAGVCIVTAGGHTGLSGGAVPMDGRPSIVLSLERMTAIEEVNRGASTMTVQAGATIAAAQEAAATADRLFAPDWGARGSATVGGAIATDAGGNNVLRYGNMRDNVMGLEVVLPSGEVWNGLRALRKDSSGYDMKHLFIGSEGTLGVVTRAVLALHPATPHVQSGLAALTDLDRLMELYELVHRVAPGIVTAFELMPNVGIHKVCDVYDVPRPLDTVEDFYVLIKLSSSAPVTDALADVLSAGADAGLLSDAVVAGTAEQEERLWFIRDHLPPTGLYPHDKIGLKMDTAVPIDRIGEYHDTVRTIAAEIAPTALAYGFGHVGDGNLHMMVLPVDDADVDAFLECRDELQRQIDEATFSLGGTLSAEHGVGQDLVGRVGGQKPAVEWSMMRSVKATFDPDGIMNPGKLLPAG